jgi:hypothetical protein
MCWIAVSATVCVRRSMTTELAVTANLAALSFTTNWPFVWTLFLPLDYINNKMCWFLPECISSVAMRMSESQYTSNKFRLGVCVCVCCVRNRIWAIIISLTECSTIFGFPGGQETPSYTRRPAAALRGCCSTAADSNAVTGSCLVSSVTAVVK